MPYVTLGLFDSTNLMTSIVLLPVSPIGIFVGIWIQRRISTQLFFRIAYILLFVTGCKLLYDGLMH